MIPPPTAIDLFSGCGGLTVGLKQAGFRVLGAVELDARASAIYRRNHPEVLLKQIDILKIDPDAFMRDLDIGLGDLDLLAGCPPCQGYSALRTKNGFKQNRDIRNGLVREMLRFAQAFMPKAVMMENVPGLNGKKSLSDLCKGLEGLGYVVKTEVRNAMEYGVPQRRRRLILVAGRCGHVELAQPSLKYRTVRDAIYHLSPAGKSGDPLHDLPENRSAKVRLLISKVPKNGGSRSSLPPEFHLDCHKACDGFKDVYGRMSWDSVAPTITGGCFNPSKGRFLHPEENRCITMREASLLQTFPPDYFFDERFGKQAIALMIGNALPPKFIELHAVALMGSLNTRRV